VKVLHCPNPVCTNTFSADEVQRAGVVKCSRCGQEFRFRSPAKPSYPVSQPAAGALDKRPIHTAPTPMVTPIAAPIVLPPAPVAYPPLAKPVRPAVPPAPVLSATPSAGAPASQPASPMKTERIVRVHGLKAPRARHPVLKFFIVTTVSGMFVAAVFFAIVTLGPHLLFNDPNHGGVDPGLVFEVRNYRGIGEKAFTLRVDKTMWTADKDLKNRLKAVAAFKRSDPDADSWLAVAVQDFSFRNPREGEFVNGAIDRLRAQFGDSLMINTKLEPAMLGGVEASRCAFEGRINVVVWCGDCYLVPHHGFAYWIFVASPVEGRAQQQLAELDEQKALAFTTERRGWAEQPPELDTFAALDGGFHVHVPKGVWRKNDPKTEDESGVIYLSGFFQSLQPSADFMTAKNATLVGVGLDKKADLKDAFVHVFTYLEKKKQEESKDYRFEPIKDAAGKFGEGVDIANHRGLLGEIKLIRGGEAMRYIMLVVVNSDAKTYGLRLECGWDNQAIWRKEFRDLIKSVQLRQR
jgi:hypothetical protein